MAVYAVRHGESVTNTEKKWTCQLDAPLTEKGRSAAAALEYSSGKWAMRDWINI